MPLFSTIDQIKQYAQTIPELVKPDNNDTSKYEYSNFYARIIPISIKQTIDNWLYYAKLKTKPLWTITDFASLLTTVTKFRESHNQTELFINKITQNSAHNYVIWGDLHGAFHSLTRDLDALYKQSIISQELIIKENYIFIFNGNVIDKSPYTLETLTLVLLLNKLNPEKVIYIKGTHEQQAFWHNFSLKTELRERAINLSNESIPLNKSINRFFNTLPLALYVKDTKQAFMRINSLPNTIIDKYEELSISFLLEEGPINKLESFVINTSALPSQSAKSLILTVLVCGIIRTITYTPTTGLLALVPHKGATTWNIFSSPILPHQQLYEFFNDAFVVISVNDTIASGTITLYYQDTRSQTGFETSNYNLISGQEVTSTMPITQKPIITVGCTLDLSKTLIALGLRWRFGLTLGARQYNQQTAHKYFIDIVFLDDQYTPYMARNNVMAFINTYQTTLLLSPLGSPTTQSVADLISNKDILVLFPYTGATIFRQPDLEYIVHFRTSYRNEAKALITYAVQMLRLKKFAIFYQDDAYGNSALDGAQEAFKKYDITNWIAVPHARSNTNVTIAAQKITQYEGEALVFFSTDAPSTSLIHTLGIPFVLDKALFGISPLTSAFENFLSNKGLRLTISHVVPDPRDKSIEIVRDYQQAITEYSPNTDYSTDSLEAYINVTLFAHIVEHIQVTITKETLIAYIKTMQNYAFKDLLLNFDNQTHELSTNIWIDTGKGPWIAVEN